MSKKTMSADEQDMLLEYSSRFMYYYSQNKAVVIGGIIAIIALIALGIGYVIYSGQQEAEAAVRIGVAEQELMMGNFETALYGDEEEFTLGFVQIANNYGRTSSGNLAKYYAAVAEYELGNYSDALNHIESFNPPRGILGIAPISMHGNILIELEQYEEAASIFEKAADWDENDSTTPENLYEAAQALIEAGNNQRAAEHLNTILSDYAGSQTATRAERTLGLISGR